MSSTNSSKNIYDTLVASASHWPENIAVADEYATLSYSDLLKETEELKKLLIDAGVTNEKGLALITKNSCSFVTGLYAGVGCGSVVMPLAHYQKPEEINKAVKEARIHFILTDQTDRIAGEYTKLPTSQTFFLLKTALSENEKTVSFIDDAAVMRFTSGTTGDAKCVVLSHQSVYERTAAANEGLQITEHDRIIWVLPMAYHFIVSIMLYIRYGAGIILCDDFLAEKIIERARKFEGTFLYASPMHIKLLSSVKENVTMPALKKIISTTVGISPQVCHAFEEKYHLPISQAFGIIEVGLPIINTKKSKEHPEAVGYALPSFKVAILDEAYNELPINETGLLGIKGPGMFDGYLSPPTKRDDVLKNGWFITGDLASMKNDGLIEIKGRAKNVINVSGNKVFPNEVEEVINQFPNVKASKVYARQHPLMGEIVAADIILTNKIDFDTEELITHCRRFLSSFKVPQRISVVDEIEMTASGKIKRS